MCLGVRFADVLKFVLFCFLGLARSSRSCIYVYVCAWGSYARAWVVCSQMLWRRGEDADGLLGKAYSALFQQRAPPSCVYYYNQRKEEDDGSEEVSWGVISLSLSLSLCVLCMISFAESAAEAKS